MYNYAYLAYRQLFVAAPIISKYVDGASKTVLITGATSGLGLEAARMFLRAGIGHLIITARDLQKGYTVREMLLKESADSNTTSTLKVRIDLYELDQESYTSVKAFAHSLQTGTEKIDMAMLNGGVRKSQLCFSKETDAECTLQVNHYSTALLSILLLPFLQPRQPEGNPGVLTIVSSEGHYLVPEEMLCRKDMLEFLDKVEAKDYSAQGYYAISKLFNVLWTRELSRHVSPTRTIINTVNPGLCQSSLLREQKGLSWLATRLVLKLFARTSTAGASLLVRAVIATGQESHGQFLSEGDIFPFSPFVESEKGELTQRRLWDSTWDRLRAVYSGLDICMKGLDIPEISQSGQIQKRL